MNEYAFGPLGVATTIPAPGTGRGSRYFVSVPPFAARATGIRTVQDTAREALAPKPYCRKRRRLIRFMCPPWRYSEAQSVSRLAVEVVPVSCGKPASGSH